MHYSITERIGLPAFVVTGLIAAVMFNVSCNEPKNQQNQDSGLQSLVWVLRLVSSGRGCEYIKTYLDQGGVSCIEVPVGSTRCPMLVSKSGQKLDLRRFHPWYSMGPGDFRAEEDDRGAYYVEKHSGTAFRVSNGKLVDFWMVDLSREAVVPKKMNPGDSDSSATVASVPVFHICIGASLPHLCVLACGPQ